MPIPESSDFFVILFVLFLILTSGKLVSLGQAIGRGLDGPAPASPPPSAEGEGPTGNA